MLNRYGLIQDFAALNKDVQKSWKRVVRNEKSIDC